MMALLSHLLQFYSIISLVSSLVDIQKNNILFEKWLKIFQDRKINSVVGICFLFNVLR
jgi:hypothetical protein